MKLLSINNYHYRRGGAEVVFLEQNRLFERAGWEVIPFAMHHPDNLPSTYSNYFINEIEFGRDYSLTQKILNTIKITHSSESQQKIRQLSRKTKPNIAHAHNIYHHISPSIFKALKAEGIPTFLTLHDLKIACPAYKMLNSSGVCEQCKGGNITHLIKNKCIKNSTAVSAAVFVETLVQRVIGSYKNHVDCFIVPSKFYLEKFVEWGWPRERFRYIPNFVDSSALPYDANPGEAFVYFGRLGPEKGLQTLIRAAALSDSKVIIAGTGPEEDRLRLLAKEVNADIEFAGYQTGSALHNVIHSSKAVILPSEWYENAPLSIMEAYALGRPIIGADIGGIPELIQQDKTGAVFTSKDPSDLASQMTRFKQLPKEKIIEMGAAGRRWMDAEFTKEKYLERLVSLYKEFSENLSESQPQSEEVSS